MGPRSDNRGYECLVGDSLQQAITLQWVHGPITVVMARCPFRLSHNRLCAVLRAATRWTRGWAFSRQHALLLLLGQWALASRESGVAARTEVNSQLSKNLRLKKGEPPVSPRRHSRARKRQKNGRAWSILLSGQEQPQSKMAGMPQA